MRRIVQQVFADVEANAAGADDRDPLADRRLVAQHVEVRQHLRMLDAVDRRHAHLDAGGDDHVVEAARQQLRARDALAQPTFTPVSSSLRW